MSQELFGLALMWFGAALALLLGLRTLLTSAVEMRVRIVAFAAFAGAVAASFFLGAPVDRLLAAPISVTFFSVLLLVVVTVIAGAHPRGRR